MSVLIAAGRAAAAAGRVVRAAAAAAVAGAPISTTTDGKSDAIVWFMNGDKPQRRRRRHRRGGLHAAPDTCAGVRQWTSPIAVKGRIVVGGDGHLCSWLDHPPRCRPPMPPPAADHHSLSDIAIGTRPADDSSSSSKAATSGQRVNGQVDGLARMRAARLCRCPSGADWPPARLMLSQVVEPRSDLNQTLHEDSLDACELSPHLLPDLVRFESTPRD